MSEIVIAILGSGALSALVSGVFALLSSRRTTRNGTRAGVRIILYDRIKYLGGKYIEEGEITAADLEDIIEMHRIYHDDLGGNGFLDALIAKVKLLPIKRVVA